jgi:hypothetical protein
MGLRARSLARPRSASVGHRVCLSDLLILETCRPSLLCRAAPSLDRSPSRMAQDACTVASIGVGTS